MSNSNEDLLIAPPSNQQQRFPKPIRIQCEASEKHFMKSVPSLKVTASVKPIQCTMNNSMKQDRYRSEIIVHNNPHTDFYIKKLRVAYPSYDDSAIYSYNNQRSSGRSHSLSLSSQRQQQGKCRSISMPRSSSRHVLHKWIDDICSNEKLMNNDDISFFIKNGEFLARI